MTLHQPNYHVEQLASWDAQESAQSSTAPSYAPIMVRIIYQVFLKMATTTAVTAEPQSVPIATEHKEDLEERYVLPRSNAEAERMQNQHHWLKGGAGGLVLAPIDTQRKGLRVLDSATADGYWVHDVRPEFAPGTEFFGFDSDPEGFPPLDPPVNIIKHNLVDELPADWQNSFDFIHQRFIIPLFASEEVNGVLRNLTAGLRSGGWVQLVEMNFKTPISTPLESVPTVRKIHEIISSVVSAKGDPLACTKLAGRLTDLGLTNVGYKAVPTIAGAAHPDAEIGERGRRNMLTVLAYFQSVANREALGYSEEEWAEIPKLFEEEMKNHKVALEVWYVWGQKA
ncbi:N-methyltransferase verN [Paramyrothecium foliicola]|nr:N-methyltransferase verN [Paramyrothecium foliicola]